MTARKKLHIGMSLAPTWLSNDGWRHENSDIEGVFGSDFYVDIAQRAEAAKLDFVFRPDNLFLNSQIMETTPGFASLDATVLMAALARETSKIGLLTTVSTTFMTPYVVARQVLSLHHLSKGRAGLNIVTALDGNVNFGLDEMPTSDERYARAAEFTQVVEALWRSFPVSAFKRDRMSGHYADTSNIKPIDHEGTFFKVKGPLNIPSIDEVPIPLFQAGASPVGRNFAASVANGIFSATPDIDAAISLRNDLRSLAERHGRKADDVRLLPGLSLYLAPTREEARELFSYTHARGDRARKITYIRDMTGLDLTDWPEDRLIRPSDLPPPPEKTRSKTHAGLLQRLLLKETLYINDLLRRPEVISAAHWQVIGTVDDAVEEIQKWSDVRAIDGFITAPGGSTSSMHLALDELMPRLSEAGLLRSEYTGDTFAHHLLCE
ncbi:NtaA/DmoA family FMN-dependent monooxygenase [Brucella thiophenivorans]|uniref:FMN-dependent oxidoreductase, nitrilotriacetate monooxygenase family protein n=1 Tax=Brucella thiophenivorans TaxID=571255 RepID=A0A256FTW0_9HYPH|nr:NtaA/DmoA family FMN-dependent monooxygenase [Brucella thiophenivorans]OYR18178.1 FMN-dependent oxidoreductase, nitrilotriacetate monooxygenase family protein [Brucella thiophenivorans]